MLFIRTVFTRLCLTCACFTCAGSPCFWPSPTSIFSYTSLNSLTAFSRYFSFVNVSFFHHVVSFSLLSIYVSFSLLSLSLCFFLPPFSLYVSFSLLSLSLCFFLPPFFLSITLFLSPSSLSLSLSLSLYYFASFSHLFPFLSLFLCACLLMLCFFQTKILSDNNRDTRVETETLLAEFLSEIRQCKGAGVDFSALVGILVPHCKNTDQQTQGTALQWLHAFMGLNKDSVIPFSADVLGAILPSLSHRTETIRESANAANQAFMTIIAKNEETLAKRALDAAQTSAKAILTEMATDSDELLVPPEFPLSQTVEGTRSLQLDLFVSIILCVCCCDSVDCAVPQFVG